MSAFSAFFDRSGAPIDPGVLERVMMRLSHRGPDGADTFVDGNTAFGHYHFWTTPEEIGEHQPLKLDQFPFVLVMDGRLDNRGDLIRCLAIAPDQGCLLSDAALVLHAYAAWGEHCFERFIGEFALVIFDQNLRSLFCARSPIGTRTLFYAWFGQCLVVASEPWAVVAASAADLPVSDTAVAHYFAFLAPPGGETFFQGALELQPAHLLKVTYSSESTSSYWQPDFERKLRYKDDAEYAEHFLALMQESISCRTRSSSPIAVLMSGGLDSTAIASLAARFSAPDALTTYSYVFDDFPECDERSYMQEIHQQYETHSFEIPCDDVYPFHNWPEWLSDPNYPIVNYYWPIRRRVYQNAYQQGINVFLTGDFGDHLYAQDGDWLADLLFDGFFPEAVLGIYQHLIHADLRSTFFNVYLRRVARRFLNLLPFGYRLRHKQKPHSWLTPFAASMIDYATPSDIPDRYQSLLGKWTAQMSALEPFYHVGLPIEFRYPCRDQRLLEFVIALPSYQLYKNGFRRHILRTAMQDVLPDKIRLRKDKTSFVPLFNFGFQQKKEILRAFLEDSEPIWGRYVNSQKLLKCWDTNSNCSQNGAEKIIPWLCLAYSIWHKRCFTYFSRN